MYPSSKIFNSVKVASTHVVQNYCEALMETKGLNNAEGKKKIYEVAKSYLGTEYDSSYVGIVRKMEALGFEKFSFHDLDLTALKSILLYSGSRLGFELPNNVWLSLKALARYKNDDSHDSTNQPLEEALKWADEVMAQISRFIDYAEQDIGILEYERQRFSQASRSELDKLPSEIRSFHDELFRERLEIKRSIKRDVDEAVANGSLEESAVFIAADWSKRLQGGPHLLAAITYLDELLFENDAYHDAATLADRYFGIEDIRDFNKALHFFELTNTNSLPTGAMIKYASIHLNGLAEKSSAEIGEELLKKCCEKNDGAALIADAYYHGKLLSQSFNKALLYYNRADINDLEPVHLIQLAGIHLNGLANASCRKTGEKLLAKCSMSEQGSTTLGNAFFYGHVFEKDYERAADCYERHSQYPQKLQPALNLASIHINNLTKNGSKERGLEILEICKKYEGETISGRQIEIHERITDEGFLFYETNLPNLLIKKPARNRQPQTQSRKPSTTKRKKKSTFFNLLFGR